MASYRMHLASYKLSLLNIDELLKIDIVKQNILFTFYFYLFTTQDSYAGGWV